MRWKHIWKQVKRWGRRVLGFPEPPPEPPNWESLTTTMTELDKIQTQKRAKRLDYLRAAKRHKAEGSPGIAMDELKMAKALEKQADESRRMYMQLDGLYEGIQMQKVTIESFKTVKESTVYMQHLVSQTPQKELDRLQAQLEKVMEQAEEVRETMVEQPVPGAIAPHSAELAELDALMLDSDEETLEKKKKKKPQKKSLLTSAPAVPAVVSPTPRKTRIALESSSEEDADRVPLLQ